MGSFAWHDEYTIKNPAQVLIWRGVLLGARKEDRTPISCLEGRHMHHSVILANSNEWAECDPGMTCTAIYSTDISPEARSATVTAYRLRIPFIRLVTVALARRAEYRD